MDSIDIVFNYLTQLIVAHKPQSIGLCALLMVVLAFIKPEAAKATGRALSDLIKRIPILGKPLEKKIETTIDNVAEGMQEDDKSERIEEIKKDLLKNDPILSIPIPGEKENSK
jgi:uncharacterized membrane-anchored protein YjiN (DUF445 family)